MENFVGESNFLLNAQKKKLIHFLLDEVPNTNETKKTENNVCRPHTNFSVPPYEWQTAIRL